MEENGVYDKRDVSPWRLWSIVTSKKEESQTKGYGCLHLYKRISEVESKIKICRT